MHKLILVAGLAAAALIPSMASAQQSCEAQRGNQVAGTVVGAGLGALVGSAIAGRGDHTTGAVIGGVGGAVVGNQLSAPNADCAHAYGYYDSNSRWHATSVSRADARGYYDRNGGWVDGAPNGYYQGDRWVPTTSSRAGGYTDSRGRWIPASANGYYDDNGAWVTTVSGYYDGRGRWIAGQTSGAYDSRGRWIVGASSGHNDANGVWVADSQAGYYGSDRRWRAGPSRGYYDARGAWVGTTFDGRMPRDLNDRETWMERRIRSAIDDGSLSRNDGRRRMNDLQTIRSREATMRDRDGQLSGQEEVYLQAQLDSLGERLPDSGDYRRPGA